MPATLAAGETHGYKHTECKKNEDGDVEIKPRQVQTCVNGPKKGATDSVLFSAAPRAMINGEPYMNAGTYLMRTSKPLTKPAEHDNAFKPAKHVRLTHNAAYDHLTDYKDIKKNFRDEDGDVVLPPKNIMTSRPKVGNCAMKGASFGGMAEHLPDDYNAAKKLARKELDYHLSKLQEANFSQRVKPMGLFNPHKVVYDLKVEIPHRKVNVREPTKAEHDKPFKPSHPPKVGHNKTLGAFPEYKENPLKFVTRK